MVGDLNSKKTQMINKIEAERPKVPIYEEIPSEVRVKLLKKGEKEFKEEI